MLLFSTFETVTLISLDVFFSILLSRFVSLFEIYFPNRKIIIAIITTEDVFLIEFIFMIYYVFLNDIEGG